jgi:GNAT superfamily N-acetyltransferase
MSDQSRQRPGAETVVREATGDDVAELNRLNAAFNGGDEPAAALAARLADPARVELALVAEREGRLVGFAGLRVVPGLFYAEPQAELTELYVEAAFRRQGIGRALVEAAVRRATEAGATGMTVRTGDDNAEAIALYQRCGFFPDDISLWRQLGPE